jgi:hypothetical protein
MAKKRKFFKTVFQVEVLSEDESLEGVDLMDIASEITTGDSSGVVRHIRTTQLSSQQVAKALMAQGSDPEFFGLDEEGHEISDE